MEGSSTSGRDEAFATLSALLGLLRDDDMELKKLHICRFQEEFQEELRPLLSQLKSLRLVSEFTDARWDALADIDELISATRKATAASSRGFGAASAFFSRRAPSRPSVDLKGMRSSRPTAREPASPSKSRREPASPAKSGRSPASKGMRSARIVDSAAGPSKSLLARIRSHSKVSSALPHASTRDGSIDFRTAVERAAAADPSLTQLSLASSMDFSVLSPSHKSDAIGAFAHAARSGALTTVHLDSLSLDLGCSTALCELLSAPMLQVLTLTNNKLNEAAVRAIAAALTGHPSMIELSIGDQNRVALSTRSVHELLDAMESVPTLRKLRLGTVNDDVLRRRYLRLESAHVDAIRGKKGGAAHDDETEGTQAARMARAQREVAETAKHEAAAAEVAAAEEAARREVERARRAERAAAESIWRAEAERIATNAQPELGRPQSPRGGAAMGATKRARPEVDATTHYVLTGSSEWHRALRAERRATIDAFARNTTITHVVMSDCMVDDDIASAWAAVLGKAECAIVSLHLTSNPISSKGVEALATALRTNLSLTELTLANLHGKVSKEAEEAFAAALEQHTSLIKLSHDFKSHKARDECQRWLRRNELMRREARGWKSTTTSTTKGVSGTAAVWNFAFGGAQPISSVSSQDLPRAKPPFIRAATAKGTHVSRASEMWTGFLAAALQPNARGGGGDDAIIFDPEALPRVEMPEHALPTKEYGLGGAVGAAGGEQPAAGSLAELIKSALSGEGKSKKFKRALPKWADGVGRQEEASGGVGAPPSPQKAANPLADAVARKARRIQERTAAAAAKFDEERHDGQSWMYGRQVNRHTSSNSLAGLLESSGVLHLITQEEPKEEPKEEERTDEDDSSSHGKERKGSSTPDTVMDKDVGGLFA